MLDSLAMQRPEEAIGDGPFIYIAIPKSIQGVPLNCTKLIREWEHSIDPTRAIVTAIENFGTDEIAYTGEFVEPTLTTTFLIRQAADDPEVVQGIQQIERLSGNVVE